MVFTNHFSKIRLMVLAYTTILWCQVQNIVDVSSFEVSKWLIHQI